MLSTIGAHRMAVDPGEPHRILAQLGLKTYLTTNPDTLLETALTSAGREPSSAMCPWNEYVERGLDNPQTAPDSQHPLVYHLFGRFGEPESIVLTEDDYFDYLIGATSNRDLIPAVVRRALSDTALLFLGFRLHDWGFRVLFRSVMRQEGWARRLRYSHVAVQIDPEEGRFLEPGRARQYLKQSFQTDQIHIYWGSVEDFLRDLAGRWNAEIAPESTQTAPALASAGASE
jgi:hypothetical protein